MRRCTPGFFYSKWLPQLAVGKGQYPRSYDEFGELATYLRYVERSSRKLARSTFHGVRRWQAKLEQKQSFLARIVDIGAELFAIASAVCCADTIGREYPERTTEAVELAELFCEHARARAESLLFNKLWSNRDDANYAAAQCVLGGRYTWLEEGIADPSGDGPMMPPLVEQAATGDEAGATRSPSRATRPQLQSSDQGAERSRNVIGFIGDVLRSAQASLARSHRRGADPLAWPGSLGRGDAASTRHNLAHPELVRWRVSAHRVRGR